MSGTINFQTYPTSNRTPGIFAEIVPPASTAATNQRALLIGQMLSGGTATANTPVQIVGATDAATLAGANSMLALMAAQYRTSDTFGEVWMLPLADDGAAVAATGSIAVTAPPSAAGTLALYIAGTKVPVAVGATDTATTVATNIAAAVNAAALPVTATSSTSTVTLTARNKGLCGNDIDIRTNYRGALGGEALPAGLALTITAMSGGTQNPSNLATALASLTNAGFDFIAMPYTDSASLTAIEAFLNDTTGRWSWQQELFGHAFAAYRGTVAALTTFGTAQNSQHVTVMGFYDSPTWAPLWAADIAANAAVSLRADPGLPLGGLDGSGVVLNVLAPPVASRFIRTSRNTLLFDGISTFVVDQAGAVHIERLITTYQTNGAGQPDTAYLDVNTMFGLTDLIRAFRTYFATQFPRKKLVADGTRIPAGSNMVTPTTVKVSAIAYYRDLCNQGRAQGADVFAKQIQAVAAGNGLLEMVMPFQLVGQLRQIAMSVQFNKTT